ncbi:putative RNA-directed DNA polymerase, eukaryota [Tanacetum coccineum]
MNELINEVEDGLKDVGSGPLVDHFNEMDNGLKVVINVDSNNEIRLDSMRSELNDGTRLDNLEVRRRKREVSPSNSNKVTKKKIGRRSITKVIEVARKKEIREMIRVSWRLTKKERKKVDDNVGNKCGGPMIWIPHGIQDTKNSRGIMVIWDMRVFDCKEAIGDERFIAVRGAWCIFGDLDVVRKIEDRLNSQVNVKEMINFNDFVNDMRLIEILLGGGSSPELVMMNRKLSDHCPIVLKDMKKDMKSICPDSIFHDKLKNIKTSLRGWSKDRFGGHTEKIENLKKEAIRFRWDVEGDENLKFFYSFVKRKNNKCNLRGILVNGVWCKEPVVIKTEIARHYKRLFSKTRKSRPIVSNLKVGRISFEDAHRLEIAFSKNEVWESIRGCGGDKVPRPDDLNFKFIMKVWNIIKLELLGAITWYQRKIHGGEQLAPILNFGYDDHDNTIPYHQYQLNNEVESVPTDVSSVVPGGIYVITILDDLRSQLAGHIKTNEEQSFANDSLKAELERYKTQVQNLEQIKKGNSTLALRIKNASHRDVKRVKVKAYQIVSVLRPESNSNVSSRAVVPEKRKVLALGLYAMTPNEASLKALGKISCKRWFLAVEATGRKIYFRDTCPSSRFTKPEVVREKRARRASEEP